MTAEISGGGKLSQSVPDHVFGDVDGHVTPAVMHTHIQTNHQRGDSRPASPGLDDGLLVGSTGYLYLFHKFRAKSRPFFNGT